MYSSVGPSPFPEGGGAAAAGGEDQFGLTEQSTSRGGWVSPGSDAGSPQEGASPTRARGRKGSVAFGGGAGGGGMAALPKVSFVERVRCL